MSCEKEEDPDVIPEDSSLLTLRYAVTVLSQYPCLGGVGNQHGSMAGCLFPLQAPYRKTIRAGTPALWWHHWYESSECCLGTFLLRYAEYAFFLIGKGFLNLDASEVNPMFGVCRGLLIIMCVRFLQEIYLIPLVTLSHSVTARL